jgi:hypothetical protein
MPRAEPEGRSGQHALDDEPQGLVCFRPYLGRARNLVARFFGKIKQCRGLA